MLNRDTPIKVSPHVDQVISPCRIYIWGRDYYIARKHQKLSIKVRLILEEKKFMSKQSVWMEHGLQILMEDKMTVGAFERPTSYG